MEHRPFIRVVLLLLVATALPVSTDAQPVAGRAAGGRGGARRAPADHPDRRVYRPHPGGGAGGARRPGHRLSRKAAVCRGRRGQEGRSPLPARAAAVSGAGRRQQGECRAARSAAPQCRADARARAISVEDRRRPAIERRCALASERSLAAQIAGAQAQLRNRRDQSRLYRNPRADRRQDQRTAVTEGNVVSPTSGTLANLVSQDPMYVIFPIALRTGLDLRNRYATKGGFSAVVIKLRLPDGRIYGQDGKLDYVSPTVAENTDTITLRGVDPQPGASGHEGRAARLARADRRGVRDRDARRRAADHRSRHSARRGAVRSARRLRLRRRCAEQGAAAAHPARPIDPVHGRRDQRAQGRGAGHQRRAAAGPPRRGRVARAGEPAAGDSAGASRVRAAAPAAPRPATAERAKGEANDLGDLCRSAAARGRHRARHHDRRRAGADCASRSRSSRTSCRRRCRSRPPIPAPPPPSSKRASPSRSRRRSSASTR